MKLPHHLRATISLPSSKSICNRALIIAALSGKQTQLQNLSDCDDTRVLVRALQSEEEVIDIMAAGTAMRFSTAYFSATPGTHIVTGTERMRQRPIGVLVEALRQLGADISYVDAEGFPPLRIQGKPLKGGCISLPAHVSSQYISALLMIGPTLAEGLCLHLEGTIISRPYIDMTISLMRQFGAQAEWTDNATIRVAPQSYRPLQVFSVESDWSAASYWYELVALSPDPEARIVLPYLFQNSLQGDSRIQKFFRPLGVRTEFTPEGVVLTKTQTAAPAALRLDLSEQPDLAQTLVVTCAMVRQPFHFTGLQTLKIKETDRITALRTELKKMGILVSEARDSELFCSDFGATALPPNAFVSIDTYDDHRMAMAFAPCALRYPALRINHPEVVSKSYPAFWQHLESL
ncbi:MAG: 3-phosphoshikimate 1-carboxyvinyltransferase [Bacteroidaceae bacterium]|nr:3-phosphoshikimate 1-carboxyvinyltransferase [Bacteroidaceae bacterium]